MSRGGRIDLFARCLFSLEPAAQSPRLERCQRGLERRAPAIGDGLGLPCPQGYSHDEASGETALSPLSPIGRRASRMAVHFHEEDLPAGVLAGSGAIAVDTETMGLITPRDPIVRGAIVRRFGR